MLKSDIFSFCLRRSGHTAIMHWIAAQLQPSHIFKDCNMTANLLSTPTVRVIRDDEMVSTVYRENAGLVYTNRDIREKALSKYKSAIVAFEDGSKVPFSTDEIRQVVERYKLLDNAKIAIVMRDPFNLFASRIWRNRNGMEVPFNGRAAEWFNRQLKQFETEGDFIFIDYFQWATSVSCRKHTAKVLEIPFSDNFHNKQANISSFDDFDYEAVKAGFANRWKQFLEKANKDQKQEFISCLKKIDMDACNRYFMHLDCRETFKEIQRII